jgi:hypothetical protein
MDPVERNRMTANECRCGRPTRDAAYVCDQCVERLARALGDCGWTDVELETTITRQRGIPTTGGAPSAERGLPWHERGAEARRNLHGLLVSWVRFCGEERVRGVPTWQPTDRVVSLSRWLLHCVDGLALHDIGPEAVDEITDAVAECQRIVFYKRRSRVYLGVCEQPVIDDEGEEYAAVVCEGEVYAEEGAPVGTCDDCGQGVTVAIRRTELERKLDDRLCTAAEIARLSTYLGLDADRDKVRQRVHYWHRHKRVMPRGSGDDDAPLFRYGEVRSMLYAEFATRDAAS